MSDLVCDLIQLMRERRSIRKWTRQPVEDWQLKWILQAGVWAPTAANTQKVRFYVLREPDLIRRVAENTSPWFRENHPPMIILVLFDLYKEDLQRLNYLQPHPYWSRFIWQDTACAMMNMMLMAEALGLKSCWVSVIPPGTREPGENEIRMILRIHPRYILASMLFLGYGDEKVDVETAVHSGLPVKRNPDEAILTSLKGET